MSSAVLDASVFVSALSPSEVHHARARGLLAATPEDEPFLVPSLFRVEVIAALARRGESAELLDTVEALVSGRRFHAVALDSEALDLAVQVVRTARIRAYDGLYVALALARDATLLTLDTELSAKARMAYPQLRVGGMADR
jgi:predicted nucleic acid-binding protein